MKIGKYLLATLMMVTFAGMAHAAPVGLTSEADATAAEWSYNDITLSAGFVADMVSERGIDIDTGDFEMNAYMARIGVGIIDRFNLYLDLGQVTDMEYNYVILGETYITEFDDESIWGIGASALIYRWDNGLEVGANVSYREVDMALEKTTIAGTSYARSALTSIRDGQFEESQAALELAYKKGYFIPYIGIKYSDVEVAADFTVGGAQRNASGRDADTNFGFFVGLSFTPKAEGIPAIDQLSVNLEGRFIDEEAFSVGLSYRF